MRIIFVFYPSVGGPCAQIQCENGGKSEVVKSAAKCNCTESFFGPKCKSSKFPVFPVYVVK